MAASRARTAPAVNAPSARKSAARAAERPAPPAPAADAPPAVSPAAPAQPAVNPNHIAERAYYIWLRKGRPVGQDEQNWAEAVAEMERERTA